MLGLALAFIAGFVSPFAAGVLIYRWIADPPRRNRSTHQRRPPWPKRPNA